MRGRESGLIDRIEYDPLFRRLERLAHGNAERRCRRVRRHILRLARMLQPGRRQVAFALRGSYAQRQPLGTSDVDLVLLGPSIGDLAIPLRSAPADWLRITIAEFAVPGIAEHRRSLAFWLAMPHLLYVAGDQEPFFQFAAECRTALAATTVADLLVLYRDDPMHAVDRFHPASSFASNMKRGTGGIIEQQFIALLRLRHAVRRDRHSGEQTLLFRTAKRHERCLFVVREYAPAATSYAELPSRGRYWFLGREIVNEVAESLHDCAARFVALESLP